MKMTAIPHKGMKLQRRGGRQSWTGPGLPQIEHSGAPFFRGSIRTSMVSRPPVWVSVIAWYTKDWCLHTWLSNVLTCISPRFLTRWPDSLVRSEMHVLPGWTNTGSALLRERLSTAAQLSTPERPLYGTRSVATTGSAAGDRRALSAIRSNRRGENQAQILARNLSSI